MTLRERHARHRCIVCGSMYPLVWHHKHAKCRGGSEHWANKVHICWDCHAIFGSIMGVHLHPQKMTVKQAIQRDCAVALLKKDIRFYHALPSFTQKLLPLEWRRKGKAL